MLLRLNAKNHTHNSAKRLAKPTLLSRTSGGQSGPRGGYTQYGLMSASSHVLFDLLAYLSARCIGPFGLVDERKAVLAHPKLDTGQRKAMALHTQRLQLIELSSTNTTPACGSFDIHHKWQTQCGSDTLALRDPSTGLLVEKKNR
ncbi:hypothetical protein CLAIMM_03861 [Cladophialophora immunda]|nr:hypothetical protein CLAIMM_03861 [Cladophialophora immunda]